MFEVEQKFHIRDEADVRKRLADLGAQPQATETHSDTYYNHPSRDFAETKEAFRVRRLDGRPMITYKGPKLPGEVKARQELEWPLDPGDDDGSKTEQLLGLLSFRRVATVRKTRHPFTLPPPDSQLVVVIDVVENLGVFAEIEAFADSQDAVQDAREQVLELAGRLGLREPEAKSYLTMVLESGND